jgi:hypothetical protein
MRHRLAALTTTARIVWLSLLELLRTLFFIDTRSYQPERHYMRGPGPKWRAKHGPAVDGHKSTHTC